MTDQERRSGGQSAWTNHEALEEFMLGGIPGFRRRPEKPASTRPSVVEGAKNIVRRVVNGKEPIQAPVPPEPPIELEMQQAMGTQANDAEI